MASYYLDRGHNLDELCNLTTAERIFYKASLMAQMELRQKKEQAYINAIGG